MKLKEICLKMGILGMLIAACFTSCKDESVNTEAIASINVANAIVGGGTVRVNDYLRDSATLMSYRTFSVLTGTRYINAYSTTKPNPVYFNQQLSLNNGDVYSLFLTGTNSSPESVLIKDEIPPFANNPIVRVRVVNLSPNNTPVNITLASANNLNVFSGIAYKQVTDFKEFNLPLSGMVAGSNVFEVRNGTGILLTSYTLPETGVVSITSSRYRNITLVIKGIIGGAGADALGVFAQPNY